MRNRLFAYNTRLNKLGSRFSGITNALYASKPFGGFIKYISGVAPQRKLPEVSRFNFNKYLKNASKTNVKAEKKLVLYIDEFTNYLDVELGKDAIDLLTGLGYDIQLFHGESGRTFISKGFLKQAKELALKHAISLEGYLNQGLAVVGLEPSAILTFRDEYRRFGITAGLFDKIAANTFLIEEFLAGEIVKGNIKTTDFDQTPRTIKIHNHCHQKALSSQKVTFDILNLPLNHEVTIIPSGCCGMAGSFGYEKEHYDISMKIGELKLFPAIRKVGQEVIIAANGTSCRHQIYDGTARQALHPVSILKNALVTAN